MKVSVSLVLILASAGVLARSIKEQCPQKKAVFCYFSSWAVYRNGIGAHGVEYTDPKLCTHLIYAFAGLDATSNVITSLDPWNDLEEGGGHGSYRKFANLKYSNPCLKTLLAIGGWNEGSVKYSQMAQSKRERETFANSVVTFLQRYNFDGLDLDWEYPTMRGGVPEDKQNFVELLKILKEKLAPSGKLVTAGVGAALDQTVYDIPNIAPHVDFIQLMSYDYFSSSSSSVTAHQAPLYGTVLSVNASVEYWLKAGFPANKLVIGLPLFARTYQLSSPTVNGLGAPAPGPGQPGKYTQESGMLAYYEVLDKLEDGDWKVVKDNKLAQTYATKGSQWISYDSEDDIKTKTQYAVNSKLGGVMVWSIDTDDFRGTFSKVPRPLLQAINDVLK